MSDNAVVDNVLAGIPEDTVKALQSLVNVHNLLNQGQFQGHLGKTVGEAISFIESLHKNMMAELPELKVQDLQENGNV